MPHHFTSVTFQAPDTALFVTIHRTWVYHILERSSQVTHITFHQNRYFYLASVMLAQWSTKLLAYAYTEDIGLKGGNNVASLLIEGLKEQIL